MVVALALLLASFPEPVRKLMDLALANPPEMAADAFIRLAPYAGSRDGTVDLLERATEISRAAVHPYPAGGGVFYLDPESREGRLQAALASGLTRHALEVRAIRALLKLDPRSGTQAFLRMQPPRFPPLQCKDSLIWRPGEYYDLVREVFEDGFTSNEKRDGKHVAMLEDQLRSLASPFQLDPITRLLVNARVDETQFERLVAVYATALRALTPDDRSFTSGTRHGFTQAIYDLMARCRKSGLSSAPVLDAYRTYLERGLTGNRCADSAEDKGEGAVLSNMLTLLTAELKRSDLSPLDLSERRPHIVNERATVHKFWSSPAGRKLHERVSSLERHPEKTGEQWEAAVREFLGDFAQWHKDTREPAIDTFHQRALIYTKLLRILPSGTLRTGVIAEYVAFLAGSPIQRESPPEWYMYSWDLRSLAGTEEIRRSGHPGLLLPVELADLATRTPPR
jgi:hypothetical protein